MRAVRDGSRLPWIALNEMRQEIRAQAKEIEKAIDEA
jgi:hypothetical protein